MQYALHRNPSRARAIPVAVALTVLAAGVVLVGWFAFLGGSHKGRLTLTTPPGAHLGGVDLPGHWVIGAGSQAGYRVREKLVALPAHTDAVGRTSAVTGSLDIVNRQGQLFVLKGATVRVDMRSLASDESRRDASIRTSGLQTDLYPEAGFVSDFDVAIPQSAQQGARTQFVLRGEFTLHGVTRAIALPMAAQVVNGHIEVAGNLDILMGDFRIHPPDIAGFVTVDIHGSMEYRVVMNKQG